MWTINDALPLVRTLQPLLKPLGFHVCLGGGVLNNGGSLHDLDLYILPLVGEPLNHHGLLVALHAIMGNRTDISDSALQGADMGVYRDKVKHTFEWFGQTRRVDVFVVRERE